MHHQLPSLASFTHLWSYDTRSAAWTKLIQCHCHRTHSAALQLTAYTTATNASQTAYTGAEQAVGDHLITRW